MQMATFSAVSGPLPTVTSVSPNSGATGGRNSGHDYRHELRGGCGGDVWQYGGDQCRGGEQYDDHGDDSGGDAGAVTVTVTNPGGQSGSLASAFTYILAPTVSSVSPNSGPLAGGTAVTITGTNFATGATVTFGSTAATNVVVVSSTHDHGDHSGGKCGCSDGDGDDGGQSGSLASGFTYVVPPTVTQCDPEQRIDGGRHGSHDYGNELCGGSDGDVWKRGSRPTWWW